MYKKFGLGICLGFSILILGFATLSLGCGGSTTAATTTTTAAATTTTTTSAATTTTAAGATTTTTAAATTTTTTTSTTNTTSQATAIGDNVQQVVAASFGSAQSSSSVGDTNNTDTPEIPEGNSVTAYSGGSTPASFFDPVGVDGWITIEGMAIATGEVIRMRMYTQGGVLINSTFLASKKVASMGAFSWDDLAQGSFNFASFAAAANTWLTASPAWSTANANAFYASSAKYRPLASFWDYILWSKIAPEMSAAVSGAYQMLNQGLTLESYPDLGIPPAGALDEMGSMEVYVSGTHLDGSTISLTMSMSTDADGRPVSGSGTGSMTVGSPEVTYTVTMTQTFTASGEIDSGTMTMISGAPDNMRIVMTMDSTGAASGTVYDTQGTASTADDTILGTMTVFAAADAQGRYGYFLPTGLSDIEANRQYF